MIKDVMVHLDGGTEDEFRLSYAEALAAANGAHLTGLYTSALPDLALALPPEAGAAAATLVAEVEEQARAEGEAVHRRLQDRFNRLGMPNELRLAQDTHGVLTSVVVRSAQCADLFIMTLPYGDGDTGWGDLVRAVLFGSGRALLLVPPGRRPNGPIRTVMVAWNEARESTRALREALPFVEQARRTVLVLVDAHTSDGTEPDADVARHVARHGSSVEVAKVASGDRTVAEALLEQARRCSADLVVMGGYGHSRLAEWIMGGVTADMLDRSPYPILMAH